MPKKVILFSMLALSILLGGCGSNTNDTNEIDLGYKATQGEDITGVKEFDNDSITKEDEGDNIVTEGAQDKGVIDNFSDEAL